MMIKVGEEYIFDSEIKNIGRELLIEVIQLIRDSLEPDQIWSHDYLREWVTDNLELVETE